MTAGLLLSLALLAGRLSGFVRELVLASTLGLTATADAAIVLLTLPDLLVNLLLSGGLGVALIPALRTVGPDREAALLRQTAAVVAILFGVLGGVLAVIPAAWFPLFAPGLALPVELQDPWLLLALALALPLTALSGITTAALNARDRFFVAGCGTLIFNVTVIAGLLVGHGPGSALQVLCWAILGGALLRWVSQVVPLRGQFSAAPNKRNPGWLIDVDLLKAFVAGLLSASLLVLIPVVLRSSASLIGEGQLAAFNYALKLVELPVGVLISTLAIVIFPRLSAAFGKQDEEGFAAILRQAVGRAASLSTIVVTCGLLFGRPLISVMLGVAGMSAGDIGMIVDLTLTAMLGVPGVAMAGIAAAALNARRQPRTVLGINLMAVLMMPIACFPGILSGSGPGLMLAYPLFQSLLALLLFRKMGIRKLFDFKTFFHASRLALTIGCFAVMGQVVALPLANVAIIPSMWIESGFAVAAFAAAMLLFRRQTSSVNAET